MKSALSIVLTLACLSAAVAQGASAPESATPVLKTQQVAADAIPANWWGKYGWEWDIIPAGTPVRLCGTFENRTAMYSNQGDLKPALFLPRNEAGTFAGQHKLGWVQVQTSKGLYWTDYRDVEPVFAVGKKQPGGQSQP